MEFVFGVLFGAVAITIVMMLSLAKAAKQGDEVSNDVYLDDLSERISKVKRRSNENER